jgi:type IV secretion system protein TrbL
MALLVCCIAIGTFVAISEAGPTPVPGVTTPAAANNSDKAAKTPEKADTGFILAITTKYKTAVTKWVEPLQKYAEQIFILLLTLDVTILGIRGATDGNQIKEVLKTFVMLVFFAAFMFVVIKNYHVWAQVIVDGLVKAANEIGGIKDAADPFSIGLSIAGKIIDNVSIWKPSEMLPSLLVAGVIMLSFALMTAQIIFIKCESYVAMYAGILLLGFGGSSFTKDFAINTMRYAFSVAFKLFVLKLVIGVGVSFMNDFITQPNKTFAEIFAIMGSSIILLALVKNLPDVVGGIISGSHVSSGMAITSAASSVARGVMAAGAGAWAFGKGSFNTGSALRSASKVADLAGKTGLGKAAFIGKSIVSAGLQASNPAGQGGIAGGMRDIMQEQLHNARMQNTNGKAIKPPVYGE